MFCWVSWQYLLIEEVMSWRKQNSSLFLRYVETTPDRPKRVKSWLFTSKSQLLMLLSSFLIRISIKNNYRQGKLHRRTEIFFWFHVKNSVWSWKIIRLKLIAGRSHVHDTNRKVEGGHKMLLHRFSTGRLFICQLFTLDK